MCKTAQQEVFGEHSAAPAASAGSGAVESYQSLVHLRGGRWGLPYMVRVSQSRNCLTGYTLHCECGGKRLPSPSVPAMSVLRRTTSRKLMSVRVRTERNLG